MRWGVGGGGEGDLPKETWEGSQYSAEGREECDLDQGFGSEDRKGLSGDFEGMDKMWEV